MCAAIVDDARVSQRELVEDDYAYTLRATITTFQFKMLTLYVVLTLDARL